MDSLDLVSPTCFTFFPLQSLISVTMGATFLDRFRSPVYPIQYHNSNPHPLLRWPLKNLLSLKKIFKDIVTFKTKNYLLTLQKKLLPTNEWSTHNHFWINLEKLHATSSIMYYIRRLHPKMPQLLYNNKSVNRL